MNMSDEGFQYSKKSTKVDLNSLEESDEMEEFPPLVEELFRELVNEWLEKNGLRIVLEEVQSRPKYKRQNAGLRDSNKK